MSSQSPPPHGVHLLIDCWGASHLDQPAIVEAALLDAVAATGAGLVSHQVHQFAAGGGVTAFAVLSTSHLSIHTWPEHAYCAVDVFTCGPQHPAAVVPVLQRAFEVAQIEVSEVVRGRRPAWAEPCSPGGQHAART